jgi:cholesterol transport system auxiliary component
MTMTRISRAGALVVLAAGTLAGCFGGLLESDTPADETYRVGQRLAPPAPAATGDALGFALVVGRPRASTALDTTRIAVAPGASRFDYYTGVRWAEPAPQMVQQALVTALAASGRYAGVFAAPSRSPAELMLDVELRQFEAVASSPEAAPNVQVQLQASLVDARRATRVDSFVADAQVAASENSRAAIMAAFEAAMQQVVAETVRRIDQAATKVPATLQ